MSHRIVRTKNRWTTAQLELLVAVWEKYYQDLKAGRGNEEIYEMMVHELKSAGCLEATVKQVRGRIHNLSGKFRKEASEVQKTGKPSQWSLYSKISKFFEYTVPVRFKNLGAPVYDMSEYLQMDFLMAETIDRQAFNRNRAGQYEDPREFELDENSMDFEDDELEPDEDSVDVDRPDHEEYSGAVQYDDENAVHEFPAIEERELAQSGEEKENAQEQSEPERSDPKVSDSSGTDSDTDSLMEENNDDDCSIEEPSKKKSSNQLFDINSNFRHAAIEEFLSLLYSNQLYADVMLITCHEGVTCVMPAHRMVLANFSEFFSSVLGALKPNSNGYPLTICLQSDISQPVMQLLLQFMYTGKASVARELLSDFLRCANILRVRGVWSAEKAESVDEPDQQPPESSVRKATNNKNVSASSIFEEHRSSTSSPATVIAPSPRDSSNETKQRKTRKRRKKIIKKAKKMRTKESDQESDKLEVSSEIGFDLLRSDTENEDIKENENDKQKDSNVTIKDSADNADDGFEKNEHDDDDVEDDYDDDYIEGESIADGEGDEDKDFRTEYIETETETDTDADYEIYNVVNGDSVSNSSTPAAITPQPVPDSAPKPEAISEKKNIKPNDQIKQNGNVNGCSPHDEESQENSPSNNEVRSEHKTPLSVKKIPKVQGATKPPEIRRTLRAVPSTTLRQISLKQTNPQTDHSSKPERYSNQQTYAIQSTSGGQFLSKVRSVYSCKICGTRFNTSDGWVEHVVYTHSKSEHLTDNKNTEEHLTMLQCDLCNKYLGSEYDWVHHIMKKHTERYPHFYEELSMSDE